MTDKLMTFAEVAEYLNMSLSTVYRLPKKDPKFPKPCYPGGQPRFVRAEVIRYVDLKRAA